MTSSLLLPIGGISFLHLCLAFVGGIFGAAVGALPAFILCGFFVFIGAALMIAGAGPDFLNTFGFGFTFGPQVCFGAAVVAHMYAHKKGLSPGRDITAGLMGTKSMDVLLIGGLFGSLSVILNWLFITALPMKWGGMLWTDGVAITIFVMHLIGRLLFDMKKGFFGQVAEGESRFNPTEKSTLWLPWQMSWKELFVIGAGVGLLSSYFAMLLGADHGGAIIGFGISGLSLVFLQFGTKMPVTHHISVNAAVAALASHSLIWGLIFGVLSAFAGQFWACLFTIHADTYIDPPAAAIWSVTTIMVALAALGLFTAIPLP